MVILGAALCEDIDVYLVNILAKFKLTKWVTGDLDSEASGMCAACMHVYVWG